jgi:hypothetical protein
MPSSISDAVELARRLQGIPGGQAGCRELALELGWPSPRMNAACVPLVANRAVISQRDSDDREFDPFVIHAKPGPLEQFIRDNRVQ